MSEFKTRKWQLTINNPIEHGFSHDVIINKLKKLKPDYFCLSDEIGGKDETYHTHIYIYRSNQIRFRTIKKLFPPAHMEVANGTSFDNKQYCLKAGKWKNTEKGLTSVDGSFFEFGECPVERQGQRSDLLDLYSMLKDGATNYEILEDNPNFIFNIDRIERARSVVMNEKYKNERRLLEVTYIYGETGTGKTRSVMDRYGYSNVYQIQNYEHPFDNYTGQDVIIFEEFRSSLKIQDMLIYLDCYPLMLPCRYSDKVACYTKVFIISNLTLQEQYQFVQQENIETYRAFCRRIGRVQYFCQTGIQTIRDSYYSNDIELALVSGGVWLED